MVLILILPTYNEVQSLPHLVSDLLHLHLGDIQLRVLIVDDASTDGTAQVADDLAKNSPGRVEVLHRPRKSGLGSAYIEAFARALADNADLIGQMDADLSHDPSVLPEMTGQARNADLVIGSRYLAHGGVDEAWGLHRKLLSWCANRVVTPHLLGLPVTDATSGYRLWQRDALARIAPSVNVQSTSYGFQVEMVFLASLNACRIKEVPIYFRKRRHGRSKMNVREALAAVREILSLRLRRPAVSVARNKGMDLG
jgi:dolichol-phosphate mannosyltransferase